MTAIIDNIKLRKVVNKVITTPTEDIVEKITDQDIEENSSGYFVVLNQCIYNDLETNFKGLFTDENCMTPYSSDLYTLNVSSAVIQFTNHPPTLYAKYLPGGSIIWAEDVNHLTDAVKSIDDNAVYKDGSIAMTGNLNMNGRDIYNAGTINNVNLPTHKHLGIDIDGTTQLTEDSITSISVSKISGLQEELATKQDNLPAYQANKFLTNNGSTLSWGNPYTRNIGELVQSILPLNDSKLHLLDGSVLSKNYYADLYNYLYSNSAVATYNLGIKTVGSLQNESGVLSGFSSSNYVVVPKIFCPLAQEWEVQIKFGYIRTTDEQNLVSSMSGPSNSFTHDVYIMSGSASSKRLAIDINCPKTDGTVYHATHYSDGVFSASERTWYLRYGYKNSKLYLCHGTSLNHIYDHYEFNDSIPNLVFPYFSFLKFGVSQNLNSYPLLGNLDINECYLKIGDTIVWQGGTSFNQLESEFLVDEDTWQNYNTYYGSCGKFTINTTNQTLRLPKVSGMIEGTISQSDLGNITGAGLPNITGKADNFRSGNGADTSFSGALTYTYTTEWPSNCSKVTDRTYYGGIKFDASLSNPIYGNSTTVQPQTTKVLHYMVVSK